jgi:hypothetical protein
MVTNLCRTWIQDDMAGATGTLGEGQLFPDNTSISVTMMNVFNSALRTVSRKLRASTGPMLIFDNVDILGIPPMVSPTQGPACPDPSVQVALTFQGYFNGLTYNPLFSLPMGVLNVERVWERVNGSNDQFAPMSQPPQGLPNGYQNVYNRYWEWRQDAVNMPGSIETMDIRLRFKGQIITLFAPGVNTAFVFIPINDSTDVLAAYCLQQLAGRQGSMLLPGAIQWANEQISDFINEQTKRDQGMPYDVIPFGNDGYGSAGGNLGSN